ncbi:MAG: hypothetical protein E7158_02035 [Firmicutes bacterium]|nr:hypothetical protein [Bacillota bacterium]
MVVTEELAKKINELFKEDTTMRDMLLEGNGSAIQRLAIISNKGIDPAFIVEYYDCQTMDIVYKKAQELVEIRKLYVDMCAWYNNEFLTKSSK